MRFHHYPEPSAVRLPAFVVDCPTEGRKDAALDVLIPQLTAPQLLVGLQACGAQQAMAGMLLARSEQSLADVSATAAGKGVSMVGAAGLVVLISVWDTRTEERQHGAGH